MRDIDKIIVHCTATPEGREVSVEEIDSWHKERGWSQIGYHWVIGLDGSIHEGRPEHISGAHCKGHNKNSIGLTYVGGCDKDMNEKDTRTEAQKDSLIYLIGFLCAKFPGSKVHGHRDFSEKYCPSFDATSEYKEIAEKYV